MVDTAMGPGLTRSAATHSDLVTRQSKGRRHPEDIDVGGSYPPFTESRWLNVD